MNDVMRVATAGFCCAVSLMLTGCGSSEDTGAEPLTVAGTVTGLDSGASIELTNNDGTPPFAVTADGSYTFSAVLDSGASYDITVAKQPAGENCTVSNGTGTVGTLMVTNVLVTCTPIGYTISGSLTGLLSGRSLTVQDNSASSMMLSVDGNFSFTGSVSSGSNYAVTILAEPAGQNCAVANGSGIVKSSDVSNVSISCSDNTYNIGVTVTGLNAGGLRLANNGVDVLSVASNGSFNFNTPVASGSPYVITIVSQPVGENCSVSNGSGTVETSSVSSVMIACTPQLFTIGGAVAGLQSGQSLTLLDNGVDSTSVAANGQFSFSSRVASGASYSVTISTQPTGQNCAVTHGSGTVSGSAVNNVSVVCSTDTFNIGVAVTGVLRSGLVLQNDGVDNLAVSVNGSFNFSNPLPSGSPYAVTLLSQPAGESCAVSNGSGTVAAANIAGIPVRCTPLSYSIRGALTGLLPSDSLVVENNSGNDTTLSANGSFSFSTPIASGSAYAVTIVTQPRGQSCAVTNGSGTVVNGDVTTVSIVCSDNTYNIGVTVSGLASGVTLVLQDNAGDNLTVTANGSANFSTPIPSGSAYLVTVLSQPTGETCSVASGSGNVTSGPVSGIQVNCVVSYTIGGNVSGLTSGSLVLQNNGGNNLTLSADGSFTFAAPIAVGSVYAVTILTQPIGHTCFVGNGAGTASAANITNVSVTCGNFWTWISGSNTAGANGVYGTEGVASIGNVPGARYSPVTWTDASGNLWLFGGVSLDGGFINDLWEFNPTTKTWEWISGSDSSGASGVYGIQGIAASGNTPGAREAAISWTDASGNLWLFGGYGLDSAGSTGYLNDLWIFNLAAGNWQWVSGSTLINAAGVRGTQGVAAASNTPGARYADISWTDTTGNLWLFGGYGFAGPTSYGALNDLWEFNPAAGMWEWVSGSSSVAASGIYGLKGVASASNVPGARQHAISWSDSSGNQWLFGGQGYDSSGTNGYLNDLWEFNSAAGTWKWVSGSNMGGASGTYGSQGVSSTTNVPGAREGDISWTDAGGSLWLFGGYGSDSSGNATFLNDLWKFDPTASTWEWVNGSRIGDAYGAYGAQGVASVSNGPGSRYLAISWRDSSGSLWLMGGSGYAATGGGYLNDLWQYVP